MDSLLLPTIVLLLGILLMVIELFVPSGGAIGVFSAICFFVAVVMAFFVDVKQGFMFLFATAIIVPAAMVVMIKIWPFTPMGRRMFADLPTEEDVIPNSDHYRELHELVGKRGVAKTKMLPSGSIRVNGKTYDAVSKGLAVEEGQKVEVIAIKANHIVVRPITQVLGAPVDEKDILAQSPESLGIEPLGIEPPAIKQADENVVDPFDEDSDDESIS